MALGPDNVTIRVENEIIFQGKRERIVVSLFATGETKFGVQTLIRGAKNDFLDHLVGTAGEPSPRFSLRNMSVNWDDFLRTLLMRVHSEELD